MAAASLEPGARADRWSAVLLPDGRGSVERGGFGDVPETVLGLRSHEGRWVFESAATRRLLDDVLANGEPADLTHVYEDPAFGPRAFEFAFDPLVIDGGRVGVGIRCTEITARRAQSRAGLLHARMLEALAEGVLLVDANGVVLTANPAAESLLGAAPAGLSGLDVASFGAAFAEFARDSAQPAVAGGAPFELRRRDGTSVSVSATSRPLAGDRDLAVVVLRDLTEVRRLQSAADAAVRGERERIARDLHDGVGQELTAVALLLRGLSSWLKSDRPDASAELDRVVQLVNGVIGGARSMAHELFEATVPDRDLVTALAELARSRNALAGATVSFRSELASLPTLEPRVGAELLRIAQEATTNALRHGGASRIDIRLLEERGAIRLVVEDDGRGLPPDAGAGGGRGLGIMRFRAHSLGAELELGPGDCGGTRVSCRVAASGR